MLNLYQDLTAETTSRLQVAANSTLFTSTRVGNLVQDANQWATSLYLWPMLERAKTTSTDAGKYYYDYPAEFRTDSIVRLSIDGVFYKSIAFADFLERREDSNFKDKVYADYARQYFIHPIPTASGSNNLDVWGVINAPVLVTDSKTIFSDADISGNEAIVKKAVSVAIAPKNKNRAMQEENEARAILGSIYAKIITRTQKDQPQDRPFFNVPQLF